MPFARLFQRRRRGHAAHALYAATVVQARQPEFYTRFAVADTVDGRFDVLALHAFLLLRRLGIVAGPGAEEARALSQAVFDLMFADMDQNLREIGVGDLSVGKKVRQMAEAFYGRINAYEAALDGPPDVAPAALAEGLARNLYRGAPPAAECVAALALYVLGQWDHLKGLADAALCEGQVEWILP
jgi:cytochrome b pre-mRNA-processing protein 3